MPRTSTGIDQPSKKTLRKISLMTLFLLMCLVGSSLPIRARLIRKIKTTKKFLGTVEDKNRVAAIISLP